MTKTNSENPISGSQANADAKLNVGAFSSLYKTSLYTNRAGLVCTDGKSNRHPFENTFEKLLRPLESWEEFDTSATRKLRTESGLISALAAEVVSTQEYSKGLVLAYQKQVELVQTRLAFWHRLHQNYKDKAEKAGTQFVEEFPILVTMLKAILGLNDAELGHELGVAGFTVGRYASGDNVPDFKYRLALISKARQAISPVRKQISRYTENLNVSEQVNHALHEMASSVNVAKNSDNDLSEESKNPNKAATRSLNGAG